MEDIREVRRKFTDFIKDNHLEKFLLTASFNRFDDDWNIEDAENINEFVMDIPPEIPWHTYGSTKFVFTIPGVEDWVFKIPFKGRRYYHWDETQQDYILSRRFREDYYEVDHCNREYQVFLKAFKYGLDEFFAATFYCTTIFGVDIYCSQDAATLDTVTRSEVPLHPDTFRTSADIAENYKYGFTSAKPIAHLLKYYPQKTVIALLDFLEKYKINDLWCDNYFYTKDSLVIVDYSGYTVD